MSKSGHIGHYFGVYGKGFFVEIAKNIPKK